ncbi:MAG: DUF4105 domain-containing protein [Gammaproteobacteria bacterium]|nr:DUF4105 domain-containing protein [Gammaproteobacteria bacterium]
MPGGVRAESTVQLEGLVQQARVVELGRHPTWLALLHYKQAAFWGSVRSQVDDDAFFFSEQGRTGPQAELEATLKAMLLPAGKGHAQCLFPARWHWLRQQLSLPSNYDVACPKLEAWMNWVGTDGLSLIFPSMFLGNPGSSFGHTFLRFDGGDSVMLSQALNYAARNDPEDGMVAYVYNGVFGGYTGIFQVRSYFETVQVYSDIENRDIWEYQLDFSAEEIRQLARHVWEVTDIDFDYFFFRENCSYRLLALLDAVKADASLTAGNAFSMYAIPVDTVRALDEKGWVLKKSYRPSLASQLRTGLDQLTSQQRNLVMQLAEGELMVEQLDDQPLTPAQKIDVLEQAYTLLQFRGQADLEQASSILLARSRLPARQEAVTLAQPKPPEAGHASARLAYGVGRERVLQTDKAFVDLQLRPAFHDLVDAPLGYTRGSEINVMDAQLRWLPEEDRVRLESLRFFNIVSLSPVSDWYAPLSWQLDVRLQRQQLTPIDSDMAFLVRGGGGYSLDLAGMTLFAMAMIEADASDHYIDGYSLLAGGQLGALLNLAVGQILLQAENVSATSGLEIDKENYSVELQFNLAKDLGLRLGYKKNSYEILNQKNSDEAWAIKLHHYF